MDTDEIPNDQNLFNALTQLNHDQVNSCRTPKRHVESKDYGDELESDRGQKHQRGTMHKDTDRTDSSKADVRLSNQGENEHKENNQEQNTKRSIEIKNGIPIRKWTTSSQANAI